MSKEIFAISVGEHVVHSNLEHKKKAGEINPRPSLVHRFVFSYFDWSKSVTHIWVNSPH